MSGGKGCQFEMLALVAILFATAVLSSAEDQSALTINSTSRDSCKMKYTPGCIEADMSGFFRLLAKAPPLELLPGVTVTSNLDDKNSSAIDSLSDFLKSLTLRVAIYNEEALSYIYTLTSQPANPASGRGKKFKFLSLYTVFAMAFALLSALVGKAMTLSIVSLVMAMLARNLPATSSASSPVYDIVRRPQVQMAHTQTQEDVYEGAHSYPVGYVYPRVTSRSSHPYYAHTPEVPTESPSDNVETTSKMQ